MTSSFYKQATLTGFRGSSSEKPKLFGSGKDVGNDKALSPDPMLRRARSDAPYL